MNVTENEALAHDEYYDAMQSGFEEMTSVESFIANYEAIQMQPFYKGGVTKGYVRGLAIHSLFDAVRKSGKQIEDTVVLDAGSGQGMLSIYLACKGFQVIGVDLSSIACEYARAKAIELGVDGRVSFNAESLGALSIQDQSIDFIIGHASLHHFIKYDEIPQEFYRVLKPEGQGFFADSFGENKLFHLFHNREQMERLGDVCLTLDLIETYFSDRFNVQVIPTDWLVMFDKLHLKIFPTSCVKGIRAISSVLFRIDRSFPCDTRFFLALSGAAMTVISKKQGE